MTAVDWADVASVLTWPFLAGIVVLLTHIPLGEQVLVRGIVFIDLAIAQCAALGALLAGGWSASTGVQALAACGSALAGAALVAWLGRRAPEFREALIGLVYVIAAALAVLAVSADPHGGQRLATMLSGDVLWITGSGVALLAAVSVPFLLLHLAGRRRWSVGGGFYPWFAVLVSLSVPLLGLYLVFTALIVPALVRAARPRLGGAGAFAVGVAGWTSGLAGAWTGDWPTGPTLVIAMGVVGVLALAIVPRGGRGATLPA